MNVAEPHVPDSSQPAERAVPSAGDAAFGIYVHFPYCLSKCPYCDFASKAVSSVPHRRYADGVLRELELRRADFPRRAVTSLYFGGGTPSLWDGAEVARVLAALRAEYDFTADCEVTLEANPGAADEERFAAYRAAGVNRLSIGAQSFDRAVLANLGRQHGPEDVTRAVATARAAGFDNVSVDLIYGAPGHTEERVRDDARRAVDLGTEHLSAYALTLVHLAEEVPMARAKALGRIVVPTDDEQADHGAIVREELSSAGFVRYEISNYARGDRQSRHNLLYWRGGGYLALGVGASGHVRREDGRGGIRYMNRRTPEQWFADIEAGNPPERDRESTDVRDVFHERLFTGLRLVEGLDLVALDERCGTDVVPRRQAFIDELVRSGMATWDGRVLALTDAGLDLHGEICSRLAV